MRDGNTKGGKLIFPPFVFYKTSVGYRFAGLSPGEVACPGGRSLPSGRKRVAVYGSGQVAQIVARSHGHGRRLPPSGSPADRPGRFRAARCLWRTCRKTRRSDRLRYRCASCPRRSGFRSGGRAPYRAGRIRSVIPASTMTTWVPAAVVLPYNARVTKSPHCPTSERPSSKWTVCPGSVSRRRLKTAK